MLTDFQNSFTITIKIKWHLFSGHGVVFTRRCASLVVAVIGADSVGDSGLKHPSGKLCGC